MVDPGGGEDTVLKPKEPETDKEGEYRDPGAGEDTKKSAPEQEAAAKDSAPGDSVKEGLAEAAQYALGALDALSDMSTEAKKQIGELISGLAYNISDGLVGSAEDKRRIGEKLAALQEQVKKLVTGEMSTELVNAIGRTINEVNRAETPRERGKALVGLMDTMGVVMAPEFARHHVRGTQDPDAGVPKKRSIQGPDVSEYDAGVHWGKGTKPQGDPFEDHLIRTKIGEDKRLPKGFPVFDAYDKATGVAHNIKTLDAITGSRLMEPGQIFTKLKGYIDKTANFVKAKRSGQVVEAKDITKRVFELGIPALSTEAQLVEIRRAMRYAEERGIEFNVTYIR